MTTYILGQVAATSSPDLRNEVRELVPDRKLTRFLGSVTLPPFVAALQAMRLVSSVDPQRVGLYTITGWESKNPSTASVVAGASGSDREELRQLIMRSTNLTTWLQQTLGNAALCQSSIVTGTQGPSLHVMGDGDDCVLLLLIAEQTLREGSADCAVLVAFDLIRDEAEPDAGSRAQAIVITPTNDDGSHCAVDVVSPAAARDASALEVLESLARALDDPGSIVDVSFNGDVAVRVTRPG